MSYARWSVDSDVYVIKSIGGVFECMACERKNNICQDELSMIYHLEEHVKAFEKVPARTIIRLVKEYYGRLAQMDKRTGLENRQVGENRL